MKNVFLFALFLVCGSALAQAKKDSTELYYYGARYYNVSPCGCYTFPQKDSTYTKKDTLKPKLLLYNKRDTFLKKQKPLG